MRNLTWRLRHGEAYRHFSAIIGWEALVDSVELFGADHEFTKLVVDLKGKDPDDAFSSIPYEKGFNFLFYLENLVGKDKWDKFIPHVRTFGANCRAVRCLTVSTSTSQRSRKSRWTPTSSRPLFSTSSRRIRRRRSS